MDWIDRFQLFLFDFDGLLVDTEKVHFAAYEKALKKRGYSLDWSFFRYCEYAHLSADALRKALTEKFPSLAQDWTSFYQEKKESYVSLLQEGKISLMPGVEKLLIALEKRGTRRCVATHSSLQQVLLIRSQLPILDSIPHWITREDYHEPKPNPECYLKAISLYGKSKDRIIGFEDSLRGLEALKKTEKVLPVLICQGNHPLLAGWEGGLRFDSFEVIKNLHEA